MKKSELKSGMLITLRNGKKGIILLNTPQGDVVASNGDEDDNTWCPLDSFSDDLKHFGTSDDNSHDIVQVWSYPNNQNGVSFTPEDRTIIWKRETGIIRLNENYIATFTKTDITVGYETFSVEVLKELLNKIKLL
jgi:hypothetical protein